jgi:hypothetical protein
MAKLYALKKALRKPITKLVSEAVRIYLEKNNEQPETDG